METKRYVLFSPIGMTDPISGNRDGSMLHIARKYKPEHVYLYLSQETAAFEEADGRYAGALSLLAEKLGFHVEVTKISRPDLVDVHLFDEFYDEFEGIIKSIKDENPEAVILLNVSSGTPAMKSALHTIAAMTDDAECIPIQVSTPRKAHNERRYDVKKYDLATEWELDEDNDTERFTDRCSCSDHYNLLLKIKKEIIRNHIDAYDYRAALALAKDCGRGVGERAKAYLRAACARVQLDEQGVEIIWNSRVTGLKKETRLTGVELENVQTGEKWELACDGIFVAIGRVPDTGVFAGQVKLDPAGYLVADETCRTSVPGVFAVGDARTKAVRQVVTAAADGANAAHFAEEYLLNKV